MMAFILFVFTKATVPRQQGLSQCLLTSK